MKKFVFLLCIALSCWCCEKEQLTPVSNQQVFLEIWNYVDQNYVYFDQKGVDWRMVRSTFGPLISDELNDTALLGVCLDMLNTLRDGHNRLTTEGFDGRYPFAVGYPVHFNLDVVKANYLTNGFRESGFYTYGLRQDSIAYVHFREFERVSNIRRVMDFFSEQPLRGMILDLRDNPGGAGEDAVEIVGHFIDQPTTVGFLVEKTGPEPTDFSEPLSVNASPKTPLISVPIIVLTNRKTYSAATYLTAQMKDLSQVTLVGQITGGGGGGNQTQELSNGWLLTVSSSKFLDVNLNESLEAGIPPDLEVVNDSITLANGIDSMLEVAISLF